MSSHSEREHLLQEVQNYLGKAFEGYRIERAPLSHQSAARFTARNNDSELLLEIGEDFLEAHSVAELEVALATTNLKVELLRAEGMPMILTAEGLRLVSSN